MIKLTDLIKELDDDIIQKGFRTVGTTIDPITGKSTSTVEYLPKFDKIKRDLGETAKAMRPFKFKTDPSIADVAKKLVSALNKAQELTGALDALIKAEKGM